MAPRLIESDHAGSIYDPSRLELVALAVSVFGGVAAVSREDLEDGSRRNRGGFPKVQVASCEDCLLRRYHRNPAMPTVGIVSLNLCLVKGGY